MLCWMPGGKYFTYQIPDNDEENVIVCPNCFSQLALLENEIQS